MLKVAAKSTLTIIAIFCFISIIAFSSVKISLLSFIGNEPSRTDSFLYLMSLENHAIQQVIPESYEQTFGRDAFELLTNINFKNMETFLISEIPGLHAASPKIIVAGQGTDFTNLPIESPPPIDFDIWEGSEQGEQDPTQEKKEMQTTDHVAYIYHTHNSESFLPLLPNVTNPNHAWHKDKNVTLLGKRLGEKLEEKGIKTLVDTSDIQALVKKKNMRYSQSYQISREVAVEALKQNKEVNMVFDIHRDSARKSATTAEVNGKKYAKTWFVIGEGHPNYEKNLQFAENLHYAMEKKFPGLSRGVYGKPKTGGNNGVYNQDLSDKALLIEIGGVDNTLEELNRTVDALAEMISNYYWSEAEEVSK